MMIIFIQQKLRLTCIITSKEDIKLFAELGFKVFRMSISWTRIFPNGDDLVPNEEGLQFYQEIFETLRSYDIEPLVTLAHFDVPVSMIKRFGLIVGWLMPMSIMLKQL